MNNVNALQKNIETRKKVIEKLMLNPQQNKKVIEREQKYIVRTQKRIKKLKDGNLIEQKPIIQSIQNNKNIRKDTDSKKLIIDTSERKTISIRIKTGVLEVLKKEHSKYQTLINAILESYVINKNH